MGAPCSGPCVGCGYELAGITADDRGRCVCPECGADQPNPALRDSGVVRDKLLPRVAQPVWPDAAVASVLSVLWPILFFINASGTNGIDRLSNTVVGFVFAPCLGAVTGFALGQFSFKLRQRRGDLAGWGRIVGVCTSAAAGTALAGMVVVAVALSSWPSA